jgi:multidrug efflux pump subunit AcrA (membrane-fusion protein)
MNKMTKYAVAALLVLGGGVIFYNKVYIPKSTYAKVTPTKGDLNVAVFGIGNVGAKDIYSVNAQTSAKILTITKDAGDWVKKGELLVTMDPVDLPELLAEAKISVKKAALEYIASKKELYSLIAQKKLALITYKRYEKLKEQSFASQSEYDKAKADLDSLNAQISASKARINSASQEIVRAKKSVEALEVKLSRYSIVAPIDGYIISREADVQESVLPTQPILKVVDPKTVWIKAYIDERISGDIKVGQKASITLRSQANKKFSGVVKRIAPQSDAITQEREVDVAFDNLPIPFYINEQAEVLIDTEAFKNVVKIPSNLLIHKDGKVGVWVDSGSKAHFNAVEVLGVNHNEAAVKDLSLSSTLIVPATNKKPLFEGSGIH